MAGFRLDADGTIGKAPTAAAKPYGNPSTSSNLAAWPPPYLAFAGGGGIDSSMPRTVTPVRCDSAGGEFSCTTPGGTSFGPLRAPKGFPEHAPEKLKDIINRRTWEEYQKEILDRAKPR